MIEYIHAEICSDGFFIWNEWTLNDLLEELESCLKICLEMTMEI